MKIIFLMLGKTGHEGVDAMTRDYEKRISHYVDFSMKVLPSAKAVKTTDERLLKEKEAALLLKEILPGDEVILLDEKGKEFSTVEMATWLQKKQNSGKKRLVFICGGAYGFDEKIYAMAHEQIALSRLTFPHLLVRLIFSEQLYRVLTVLKGEKYHHV
jgi:23S rRNA (pseudouridine1915-N3)-methyltransferase